MNKRQKKKLRNKSYITMVHIIRTKNGKTRYKRKYRVKIIEMHPPNTPNRNGRIYSSDALNKAMKESFKMFNEKECSFRATGRIEETDRGTIIKDLKMISFGTQLHPSS